MAHQQHADVTSAAIARLPGANRRRKRRAAYDPTAHRLRELERVIGARHGVVPATDDADVYLVPVAQCLRRLCEQRTGPRALTLRDRMQGWAQRFAELAPVSLDTTLFNGTEKERGS